MSRDRVRVTAIVLTLAAVLGGVLATLIIDGDESDDSFTAPFDVTPSTPADAADELSDEPPDEPAREPAAATSTVDPAATSIRPPADDGEGDSSAPDPDGPAVGISSTQPEPLVVLTPHSQLPRLPALDVARSLAPEVVLPSDCGLPLDTAASLPNSAREYRSGIHQGIDFICAERGREAVAALPGRVVLAVGDYVDPTPDDREVVLGIAASIGRTPPWTLAMLFGNFVVLDHGPMEGTGHVVTIYAHLNEVDETIRAGAFVSAGQRLGEIGNIGTFTAATDGDRPTSLHLHWEIHVDDLYLGAGLSAADTREIYASLFSL